MEISASQKHACLNGHEKVEDDPREGAPVTNRTDRKVDHMHTQIQCHRRLRIRVLSDDLNTRIIKEAAS